jgi:hypothetical protein
MKGKQINLFYLLIVVLVSNQTTLRPLETFYFCYF